ncbi:ribosomal protein S18 acetylase RimI-like enzyme [Streptosporangium becharense]|uniref:Ribosomal protein S18 acetylase RimI-like enzyme n=1 Tax=Streptosporangium becharense TaxID=1816182 RepID=A0A7W9MEP3_9ACTN|nr:GNAT family N-acetyltransferase [Streptosporangium becharense]MBB2913595.1 ribosomal protein S18 acetylase RimI-like enzyme [Streptosporangium becharense]MBB5817676.1 ribosomal protein S18 acetylase RimI-like enzyme [Streptosporangium becharense]
MTTTASADGYTTRRPSADDAREIHELISLCDTQVIGKADMTLDDVADQLNDPAFDLEADGWLVHDSSGRLVAWAWACRKGTSDNVDIDVVVHPDAPGLTGGLWDTVTERAGRLTGELGHERAVLDIGLYREDSGKRAIAAARGFTPATSFIRLRADHGGPVPHPDLPPGITLRDGLTEEVRRHGHAVQQAGFADHFGFAPMGYDEWYGELDSSASNDWAQLVVAYADGEPVAMLLGTNAFLGDENCGYVRRLAVLREFRGRGLGRFLLRHAFAEDARRGRVGTYLHVDANNSTPALDLYLSVGMRQVLAIDVWRCTV